MKKGLMTATALAALIVATAAIHLVAAPPGTHDTGTSVAAARGADLPQAKGRFKVEGDNCVWSSEDSGPNQCAPVTRGRFKKGGDDSCAWDSNDNGPDQCTPPSGRWKKGDGATCYWDGKDSGPNQCNPRAVRNRDRK